MQVYLRWPPGRSVRSRAASTRRRRPLRHENDCWLRLLAHVWMGFASFFVSALTRSWATGLKFYGLQRYSLKISFGQGGAGAQFRRQSGPPVALFSVYHNQLHELLNVHFTISLYFCDIVNTQMIAYMYDITNAHTCTLWLRELVWFIKLMHKSLHFSP